MLAGGDDSSGSVDPDVLPSGGSVPEQKDFDLTKAAAAAGCELRDVKASGSFDHTTDPNERVKYNSNPPTSGRHYVVPADDGAYSTAPTDEQLVHELEHGRVIIWFKPSLPADTRADLKALFDEDTYQMLLVPRAKCLTQVAASAWNGTPDASGTRPADRLQHRRAEASGTRCARSATSTARTGRSRSPSAQPASPDASVPATG